MTRLTHAALAAAVTLTLGACSQDSGSAPSTRDAVAVIDQVPITEQDVQSFIEFRQMSGHGAGQAPSREAAIEELVNMELLRQEAVDKGLDEDPQVQAQLERTRTNLLVNTLVERFVDDLEFSEEELREEYDRQVEGMDTREYRARHILVDDRETAEEMIAALEAGDALRDLAREHSQDPTAEAGGDLGWFTAGEMVSTFTEALKGLEDGAYTTEPVETRFGWHVIQREDSRERTPPDFDSVRDRLEQVLATQALQDYVEELRAEADIEIRDGGDQAPTSEPASQGAPTPEDGADPAAEAD
ncbi:MAG: peptidylprolyl isomerase [Ectothiorhodospira sp.]